MTLETKIIQKCKAEIMKLRHRLLAKDSVIRQQQLEIMRLQSIITRQRILDDRKIEKIK